jgi:hypothetical protein
MVFIKIITFYIHSINYNIELFLSEFTHSQKGLELLDTQPLF